MKTVAIMILVATGFVAGIVRADDTPVELSPTIGLEIDRAERDRYGLFPDLPTFTSARIFQLKNGKYRIEYTTSGERSASRTITADAFQSTRRHVRLVERYLELSAADPDIDARVLFHSALQNCAEGQYDRAVTTFDTLADRYPDQYAAFDAAPHHEDARRLRSDPRALFQSESLIDQSGRTEMYIFGGYYGVYLAIAIPAAADAEASEAYAVSLITVPALTIGATYLLTRDRNVTDADADVIAAGGWLGAWQGMGWAGVTDREGPPVWGWGIAGSLAGIGVGAMLNRNVDFTEGHASLTNSAVWWGAWLGLLVGLGSNADDSDDGILRNALLGSAVLTPATMLLAHGSTMTRHRVRLMNLGGVVGAIVGIGLLVVATPGDEAAAAALWGASSIAGAFLSVRLTAPRGDDRASRGIQNDGLALDERLSPFVARRSGGVTRVGLVLDF